MKPRGAGKEGAQFGPEHGFARPRGGPRDGAAGQERQHGAAGDIKGQEDGNILAA